MADTPERLFPGPPPLSPAPASIQLYAIWGGGTAQVSFMLTNASICEENGALFPYLTMSTTTAREFAMDLMSAASDAEDGVNGLDEVPSV